jgi:hypothetical protein
MTVLGGGHGGSSSRVSKVLGKSEQARERGKREKGDVVQLGCSKGVASAWKQQAEVASGGPGDVMHLLKVENKGGFAKSPSLWGVFRNFRTVLVFAIFVDSNGSGNSKNL